MKSRRKGLCSIDPSCLKYRLTEGEREAFERDGYLILEGVLEPERVEELVEVVDRLHGQGKLSALGDAGIAQRTNTLNFAGMVRNSSTWSTIRKRFRGCGVYWAGTSICTTRTSRFHSLQRENSIPTQTRSVGTGIPGV